MRILLLVLISFTFLFSSNENISLMNSVKKVIQKEEYLSLSINKYILQTGKIPKNDNDKLDWDVLKVNDYLGENFNKKNPLTSKDMDVYFDIKNNVFIKGVISVKTKFNDKDKYLYNFYSNKLFRVNTLGPKTISKDDLVKGSQVLYSKLQKEIVALITSSNEVRVNSEKCPIGNYYYEIQEDKLEYKYCKSDYSFSIYQKSPIFVLDIDDLSYIKAKIGDKAYVKINGIWYEYYYQGEVSPPWQSLLNGNNIITQNPEDDLEDRIISYIPNAKDIVIKKDGGCMLANGDIFCWGNNKYKKVGIENYGQIDKNIKPDYVNTPVMLKVQIDDTRKIANKTRRDKRWYNNPYRIKFEKMSMNKNSVCGISPIFNYDINSQRFKIGGDLFCNGNLTLDDYESLINTNSTQDKDAKSILRKNIHFASGKVDKKYDGNEIYLEDIAMVNGTTAVISDRGIIYTFGSNTKGELGIGSNTLEQINKINTDNQVFTKVFALRDINCFGALDDYGYFWIWGEREGYNISKPQKIDSQRFISDRIFVNSKDFILKGKNEKFYRTYDDDKSINIKEFGVPSTALSATIYDNNGTQEFLYINDKRELKGSVSLFKCLNKDGRSCVSGDSEVFNLAFNKLNQVPTDEQFANFSNISIFEYQSASSVPDINYLIDEDFTSEDILTWNNGELSEGNIQTGNFLTNVLTENINVSKTYKFGNANANKKIQLDFEFYEIGLWTNDSFELKMNNNSVYIGKYHKNKTEDDVTFKGILKEEQLKIHTISSSNTVIKLDANGDLKIEYILSVNQTGNANTNYKAWGVDNLKIKYQTTSGGGSGDSSSEKSEKYICAMTGLGSKSQMYCWGNAGRALPILSTSLYDVEKISTMNKLFVTQNSDLNNQMAFDEFNNDGKLFLKYPTYLGGFDYEFYFK